MRGLMQDWPLLCHSVIEHAAREHGQRRIVTRSVEGPVEVSDYAQIHRRARKVSDRLTADGIKPGDRIGTLAWSTARHLECWYGIAGIAAVYHPVNPRLFPDQIVYILNEAGDRMLLVDLSFVGLLEGIADRLPKVERYIILTDRAHMPDTRLRNAMPYEEWIAGADAGFGWKSFDENTAAGLVYTSGTTGHPKGVLLSHRSVVLMSLTGTSADMYGFSAMDVVLQVPPMCHANGWTWPYSAPMTGAGLVFPGAALDGPSLCELLIGEGVTVAGGVPTVWQGVLDHLDRQNMALTTLKRLYVGGSPCPSPMIDAFSMRHGVEVRSSNGMTEMGPLGSICTMVPETRDLTGDQRIALLQTQGRAPYLVEYRTTDDAGRVLPRDGQTMGHLQSRGPCVVRSYFGAPDEVVVDRDGFFDTGDIAILDRYGYIHITDRAKDLVKSGGEWISSIDLEHIVMRHPAVREVAVIGATHPKWDERPLLIVALKEGGVADKQALLDFLKGKIASWWMPDDVIFVEEIPHTAIGKINKAALRAQYRDHLLAAAAGTRTEGAAAESAVTATDAEAGAGGSGLKGLARAPEPVPDLQALADQMRAEPAPALAHLQAAQSRVTAIPGLATGLPLRPIVKVGVVGAGTMGGGIVMNFLNAGIPSVIVDSSQASLDRGLGIIRKNYDNTAKKGRITMQQVEQRMTLLQGSLDFGALADCDLVIEAVFEDMAVKKGVCTRLGAICKPGAIIATNTSTLDVDVLAQTTGRAADVLGMHFFSPANVMKLLEVVRGAATAPEVLATVLALAGRIGKIPVVSGVCYGFIGNRMLEGYVREADFLLMEGATPSQIDGAIEKLGLSMGPCRMLDMAGTDVAAKVVIEQGRSGLLPGDPSYRAVVLRLFELGRNGQKAGRGYYRYDGRQPIEDPEAIAAFAELAARHGIRRRTDITDQEIVERCIFPLMNEGALILEQRIAQRPGDIDVVWTRGYGFDDALGGPMYLADRIGLGAIVSRMEHYAQTLGTAHGYWTVASLLRALANDSKRISDWEASAPAG